MVRQPSLTVGVIHRDWQDRQAQVGNRLRHPLAIRQRQRQLAQTNLDGDLPHRCSTEQQVVRRVRDRRVSRWAEEMVLIDVPDDRLRVDQGSHSMYSLKSSSGASKSGAM